MNTENMVFDQKVMRGLSQFLTETKCVTTFNQVAKGGAKELPSTIQVGNWTSYEVIRFLSCPQLVKMVCMSQLGKHLKPPCNVEDYTITAAPSSSPLVGHYRYCQDGNFALAGEAHLDRIFRVNGIILFFFL